jgi:hypothetical protein
MAANDLESCSPPSSIHDRFVTDLIADQARRNVCLSELGRVTSFSMVAAYVWVTLLASVPAPTWTMVQ